MSAEAKVRIDAAEDIVIARVSGEIDVSNASDLCADISGATPNLALGVVLDLAATTYLDSSGIQIIFELSERLGRRQQRLRLSIPEGAPIRRVLHVVHLDASVPVLPTVDAAIADLRTSTER